MQEILKHLEEALTECSKRIAEITKTKKEYEAKFQNLSELEARLKSQGVDLDAREKKVNYIENVVEYNQQLTIEADRVKKEGLELAKNQKALAIEKAEFDILKKQSLKEIENGKVRNQAQADALIKERKEFEDKVKAYKTMKAAIE